MNTAVIQCFVTLLLQHTSVKTMQMVNPLIIPGHHSESVCPPEEQRDAAFRETRNTVANILQDFLRTGVQQCGEGNWLRVAFLNMSDPLQQCPLNWTEYSSSGVRTCGRPASAGYCQGVFFSTSLQYSNVCGRAIGYEYGGQEAFEHTDINSNYVYGLSITHGIPRSHIWTYAVGNTEGDHSEQSWNCPCADPDHPNSDIPPSFVGDNYYCESGNPTNTWSPNRFYPSDPLWDGQQCEGTCCSNGKSPPWFSVDLPNPTSDNIEVRICTNEGGSDTKIQLLEILVA